MTWLERREAEDRAIVVVNWPRSKETVAHFTRAAFQHELAWDEGFFRRASGILSAEGLLHNLGHNMRGLEDFPRQMHLSVPESGMQSVPERDKPNLISTMQFGDLYDQIVASIERYVVDVFRKREGVHASSPNAYQREIDALRVLAERLAQHPVTLTFEPYLSSEEYMIAQILGQGYSAGNQP